MSSDREMQNLFALRDSLVELSGALREWLFQQSAIEGTLTEKEVRALLEALGSGELKNIKGESDKKD
jgi:hypothetical protein